MDGVKYYIFDGNPIKVIWEDGLLVETYSQDPHTRQLIRNDELGMHVEKEITDEDEIGEEQFNQLTGKFPETDLGYNN